MWRPADEPDWTEERYFLPSDPSYYNYRPNRWWALCPGCGARTVVRESTMVRLMREAADAGGGGPLHLSQSDEPDLSASK